MKRFISIALLLAMAASVSSCGGKPSGGGGDGAASTTAAAVASAETETQLEADGLPALDFKGAAVNALYREDVVNAFFMKEQTGDIVDDAVYASNRAVEERLSVSLRVTTMPGTANADRNSFMSAITNSVLAGDDTYDLCGVLTANITTLIQSGVFTDLMTVKHLDFDKPWWTPALTELATVGGRLYFASGDISLELIQRTYCMLFNKKLAETLKTGDIYALVNGGKWTLDKMRELGAAAYADLNGNSQADPEDRYGVVVNDLNHISNFIAAFDLTMTKMGSDGRQHMSGDGEHNLNAMQSLVETFNNYPGVMFMSKSDADPATVEKNHAVYRTMFKNDRLLLITSEFDHISSVFRDMESEYGVIPYPKYDEKQESYHTLARNVYTSFAITKTCKAPDMVGAVMEAIASQNYRSVSPVYFETALKVKYSRDDVTSQMYDLIKDGLKFNFGFTFSSICSGLIGNFRDMVVKNDVNWASKYASFKDGAETSLQKFYDDVEKLK